MKQVKDLRSESFDLNALDNDLKCMALIRALPEDYAGFVSSLTLLCAGRWTTWTDLRVFQSLTGSVMREGVTWSFCESSREEKK